MNKKRHHFSRRVLNVGADMLFINDVIKEQNIRADAEVRKLLLELTYTLARDRILEANQFAKLTPKTELEVEDLRICDMQKTDDYETSSFDDSDISMSPQRLPSSHNKASIRLPPWRHCLMSCNISLKKSAILLARARPTPVHKVIAKARPLVQMSKTGQFNRYRPILLPKHFVQQQPGGFEALNKESLQLLPWQNRQIMSNFTINQASVLNSLMVNGLSTFSADNQIM